ncbi:hypothetical protein [Aeromonas dhakensis]|uniref:hypothetical protein n=1 Tax=Aeromonas dhakensis TaxID=196024 RepID=UPI0038CFD0B9
MIKKIIIIASFIFQSPVFSSERVEYFTDSISQKDGEYIKLLGGSSWILKESSLALVAQDVIVVFRTIEGRNKKKMEVPVFYFDGEKIVARHIGGNFVRDTGTLVKVIQEFGKGAILKLDNGTMLSIPEYDRYDTGWWLPPYQAIITGNGLYMWNLHEGKKVWVDSIQ